MSKREYVKMLIDRLADEQIDELYKFIKENFLPDLPDMAELEAK